MILCQVGVVVDRFVFPFFFFSFIGRCLFLLLFCARSVPIAPPLQVFRVGSLRVPLLSVREIVTKY